MHEASNISWAMAHWLFSAQYIYTGMILPALFTQAKIEWFHEGFNNSGEFDLKKIKDVLLDTQISKISSIVEAFRKCDDMVLKAKIREQRV